MKTFFQEYGLATTMAVCALTVVMMATPVGSAVAEGMDSAVNGVGPDSEHMQVLNDKADKSMKVLAGEDTREEYYFSDFNNGLSCAGDYRRGVFNKNSMINNSLHDDEIDDAAIKVLVSKDEPIITAIALKDAEYTARSAGFYSKNGDTYDINLNGKTLSLDMNSTKNTCDFTFPANTMIKNGNIIASQSGSKTPMTFQKNATFDSVNFTFNNLLITNPAATFINFNNYNEQSIQFNNCTFTNAEDGGYRSSNKIRFISTSGSANRDIAISGCEFNISSAKDTLQVFSSKQGTCSLSVTNTRFTFNQKKFLSGSYGTITDVNFIDCPSIVDNQLTCSSNSFTTNNNLVKLINSTNGAAKTKFEASFN